MQTRVGLFVLLGWFLQSQLQDVFVNNALTFNEYFTCFGGTLSAPAAYKLLIKSTLLWRSWHLFELDLSYWRPHHALLNVVPQTGMQIKVTANVSILQQHFLKLRLESKQSVFQTKKFKAHLDFQGGFCQKAFYVRFCGSISKGKKGFFSVAQFDLILRIFHGKLSPETIFNCVGCIRIRKRRQEKKTGSGRTQRIHVAESASVVPWFHFVSDENLATYLHPHWP